MMKAIRMKKLLVLISVLLMACASQKASAGPPQTICNADNTACATVTGGKLDINATAVTLSWTQTTVTLTAATSATLLAANASRKGLRWMVTGTNPMTVAPGLVTVIAGAGMNYSPGSGTGQQGGSDSFAGDTSTQAFSAISTLGTTVTVWEGQ